MQSPQKSFQRADTCRRKEGLLLQRRMRHVLTAPPLYQRPTSPSSTRLPPTPLLGKTKTDERPLEQRQQQQDSCALSRRIARAAALRFRTAVCKPIGRVLAAAAAAVGLPFVIIEFGGGKKRDLTCERERPILLSRELAYSKTKRELFPFPVCAQTSPSFFITYRHS